MSRVERKEQPIEVVISPKDNALMMYSNEPGFTRRLDMPNGIKIAGEDARQFLLLPGGTPPAMGIDIYNARGAHKIIRIDPVTGVPQYVEEASRIHAVGSDGRDTDHGHRGGGSAFEHGDVFAQRCAADGL